MSTVIEIRLRTFRAFLYLFIDIVNIVINSVRSHQDVSEPAAYFDVLRKYRTVNTIFYEDTFRVARSRVQSVA